MKSMTLLAALLLVPTKYDRAADRVVFPSSSVMARWAKKSEGHQRVIGMIQDRTLWAKAFHRIERKLGIFNPEGRVQVYVEATEDPRPALGGGHKGRGHIRFNIPRLVRYLDEVDAFNRLKEAGRIDRVIVPPMDFDNLICHELTHVMVGVFDDKWLTEGIASYTADDTMHLYSFIHRGSRVESLDLIVPDKDSYARGMIFFNWLEKKHGRNAVHRFTRQLAVDNASPRKALEEVTGLSWRKATVLEKLWSGSQMRRYRP